MNDTPKVSAEEEAANTFIYTVMVNAVHGLRLSIPRMPVPNMAIKVCSALGSIMGQTLSIGALGDILPLRAACIEAFTKGVRAAKIQPPPGIESPAQKLNS